MEIWISVQTNMKADNYLLSQHIHIGLEEEEEWNQNFKHLKFFQIIFVSENPHISKYLQRIVP